MCISDFSLAQKKKKKACVSWLKSNEWASALPKTSSLQTRVHMLLQVPKGFPQNNFNLSSTLDSFGNQGKPGWIPSQDTFKCINQDTAFQRKYNYT